MTKMLYSNPDETVYVSLYRNRLVVAIYITRFSPTFEPFWEGYAEVLPEDGLDPKDLMETDDIYNLDYMLPGRGLGWGGYLELVPGVLTKHQFLGFDGKADSLQETMGTACELADQIIEYGKQHRQKLKRGAS